MQDKHITFRKQRDHKWSLARGVVELVWTRWTADGVERRLATAREAEAVLRDPRYWHQTSRYERYVEVHLIAAKTDPVAT